MKATGLTLTAVAALAGLIAIVRHGRAALAPALAAACAFAVVIGIWIAVAPAAGRALAADELLGRTTWALVAWLVVLALAVPVRSGRRAVAAVVVGAAAIGALLIALGDATPIAGHLERAGNTAAYIWQIFLPRPSFMTDHWAQGWPRTFIDVYVRQAFGGYGQLAHVIPDSRAYLVLAGALVALAGAALTFRRRRGAVRARGWELALLVAVPVAVVVGVEFAYTTGGVRSVPAEQGRYLFPAAAAVGALVALAAAGLRPAAARAAVAVAVIAMGALALDGRLFYLSGTYL